MFGYVTINRPELKVKDLDSYQGYYCGLCHELKDKYGRTGQLTLTYDMTFLVILLTALYEPDVSEHHYRCITHPKQKHLTLCSTYTSYAADMNILLSYYKLMDDWQDEHKRTKHIAARMLSANCKKVSAEYSEKAAIIKENLKEIRACEQRNEKDLDAAAGCFGKITSELFLYRKDEWENTLRRMGFFLGKFIYLMDACEDLDADIKCGNYNPFASIYHTEQFEAVSRNILTMMMAECAREFEKLPIIKHADILRNIIYSGIWTRYEVLKQKRKDTKET